MHSNRAARLLVLGVLLTACGLIVDTTPPPDRSGLDQAGWALAEANDRKLTLVVPMGSPDCFRFAGLDVIETAEMVEIRAWVENLENRGCGLIWRWHTATVQLELPLGERRLDGCLLEQSHASYADRASCAEVAAFL